MKKFCKIALCFLLVVAFTFSVTACNKDSGVEAIDMIGSLSVDVGKEASLQASLMPFGAEGTITYKSSDTSVATVSDSGVVKGIAAGTATIRAACGNVYANCAVTVIDPSQRTVLVASITLNPSVMTFEVGDTQPKTITATVKPDNATNKTLTWTSGNTNVVTVSQTGVVTPVGAGQTLITAKSHNNISKVCVVTVKGDGSVETKKELYVRKIDSLANRDDFIMGMDASAVPSLENAGVEYKNFDGQVEDVYKILKDNGITDIRIRIWNYPYQDGHYGDVEYSYGGGNCDVENAVEIAKRCQKVGLGVIIDFHYSDFWADPGKQQAPKAWKGKSATEMATAIHDFTAESLTKIKATNVKITMVQIGNETTRAICGANWDSAKDTYCNYINAGASAVREVTGTVANGGAKVAVHFTNPESRDYVGYAKTFSEKNVDYDVFGTSYYPFWHGTLDNLAKKLSAVHNQYNKEVMVLETSYAFTVEDFDGTGNTAVGNQIENRPYTVQGQANQILDVIETIANLGDYGLGVCYWEGTWIAPADNRADTIDLCNQYGCGWASAKAGPAEIGGDGYQEKDVTTAGGVVIDNQAFFMSDGTPLESLKLFGLAKVGQIVAPEADYMYRLESFYTVDVGEVTLPKYTKIVLNDGSLMTPEAMWEADLDDVAEWIHKVDTYVVKGTTIYGGEAICIIYVQNKNLLTDGGFEDSAGYPATDNKVDVPAPWKQRHEGGHVLQLYVSNKEGDAEMGTKSFHFWDDAALNFDLYQEFDSTALSSVVSEYSYGTFTFCIDFAGGDCGEEYSIYAYATITYTNGQTKTVKGNEISADGWQNWNRTAVDFVIDETVAKVEVGIHVTAEAGAWGNMDNAQFFFKSASKDEE